MTSENREPGGDSQLSISSLQSNEELAPYHLQHGSDDLAVISHREVEPFHYGLARNEHLVPRSYGQGMPFAGDFSVFHQPGQNYLNKPALDYSVSTRNAKETVLEHAFGDSVASVNAHAKELGPSSLWMNTSGGETNGNNTTRPWLTGNQFIGACSPPASSHNPTIGELGASNFDFTGEGQPNYPGVLDGDFLSLGCGTYEENDSLCDINIPDSEQRRVLLPLFNTFPDQDTARGSLNCSSTIANDISSFPNCPGDYRNLTNEDSSRAQSLGQIPSGFPHQIWRANHLPNPSALQNLECSFNPMVNAGRLSHQAPATNRDRSSENNGLPKAPWLRETRIPSSSSVVGFTQPASELPDNPPITTIRNFSPRPVMAPPFVRVPGWHGQSGPVTVPRFGVPRSMVSHGQSGPVVVPSLGVSRSMPGQGHSGHLVQASTVSPALPTQGSPFSKNVKVQQARKVAGTCDQSQASVAVNLPKNTPPCASTSEKQIGQVNPPQSSTINSGPSLKRGASNLLPNIPAAQRRKTRSVVPSSPSMPKLRQISPHIRPAPIDLKPHISRLLQNNPALLSSLLGTQSSHHIKWNEEDKESPSGYQCPICKRDLSYTPEGTMYQPDKLLPTSIFPCGHYFHSSCLLRITPADQAGNPPCIPCALDG